MSGMTKNRLKFEFEDMKKYKQFKLNIDPKNFNIWYVSFQGAEKTLYQNENFTLKFHFDEGYVINNINNIF